MKKEALLGAIAELEKACKQQEDELNETREILSKLMSLAGIGEGLPAVPDASITIEAPKKDSSGSETYAQIAVRVLRDAGHPMHVNEIISKIADEKGYEKGKIQRPAVQTSLTRFMTKTGVIRRPKAGYFEYVGDTEKAPAH